MRGARAAAAGDGPRRPTSRSSPKRRQSWTMATCSNQKHGWSCRKSRRQPRGPRRPAWREAELPRPARRLPEARIAEMAAMVAAVAVVEAAPTEEVESEPELLSDATASGETRGTRAARRHGPRPRQEVPHEEASGNEDRSRVFTATIVLACAVLVVIAVAAVVHALQHADSTGPSAHNAPPVSSTAATAPAFSRPPTPSIRPRRRPLWAFRRWGPSRRHRTSRRSSTPTSRLCSSTGPFCRRARSPPRPSRTRPARRRRYDRMCGSSTPSTDCHPCNSAPFSSSSTPMPPSSRRP